MSGIITKPSNTALLQPTKYVLTFPEISDTIYFCQKANLPGVQLGMAEQSTPNLDLYHSGTKMTYNTFDISFLVNEELTAWTQIYKWMVELSSVTLNSYLLHCLLAGLCDLLNRRIKHPHLSKSHH